MANIFVNKNILVTGGSGSIGSEIVRKLLQSQVNVVRALSNDENGLFNLEQGLPGYDNLRFLLGDVRDKERLRKAVEDIDFAFHVAALKHVPICEYNPFEAVKTNICGTQNLIEVAMEENIEKLIVISSDKAVNPVNVMGTTKLLSERLTISAHNYKGRRKTAFSCVRFGNVLDSRGSVVPLFKEQIKRGGPVTITDPNMTRFIMSIPKAVDLVLRAAEISQGGEIFIFKMPALRIIDLAELMIEELGPRYGHDPRDIKVEVTGKRAGEKTYEELLTEDESLNVSESDEMFVITPFRRRTKTTRQAVNGYRSDKEEILLAKDEIREIVKDIQVPNC